MKVRDLLHERIFIDERLQYIYIYNDTYENGSLKNKITYEIIHRPTPYGLDRKYRKLDGYGGEMKEGDPTFKDILNNYVTGYRIRANEVYIFSNNTNKELV